MLRFIVLSSFLFSLQSFAKVKCENNVEFDKVISIEGDNQSLIDLGLNGVGLKKVFFFKVFYAALYLENLSQDPGVIIPSDEHKVGIIHAVRGFSKSRLVGVLNDEFARLCEDRCVEMRPYHEAFISYARAVKQNDRMYMIFFADRFEFEVNQNEFFDPIASPEYGRLLQRSLFGPNAADNSLKKGILGQDQVCRAL